MVAGLRCDAAECEEQSTRTVQQELNFQESTFCNKFFLCSFFCDKDNAFQLAFEQLQ